MQDNGHTPHGRCLIGWMDVHPNRWLKGVIWIVIQLIFSDRHPKHGFDIRKGHIEGTVPKRIFSKCPVGGSFGRFV